MLTIKKFIYEAYDRQKNFSSGETFAESESEVYIKLQSNGLIPIEIKEFEKTLLMQLVEYVESFRINDKWVIIFFRQLSTTLDVMDLKEALNLFLSSTKVSAQKNILKSLIESLRKGQSLAEAMQNHSKVFSQNVIQLINIAQHTGRMKEISERLANQLEQNYKTKKKLQSALYYPSFILILTIISMSILINVVLPTFITFFKSQETEIPLLIQMIMTISLFISENFLLICSSVTIFILIFIIAYNRSKEVRIFVDKFKLKVPLSGKLLLNGELMNSFAALSFLLESGIQTDNAIKMVSEATSNKYLRSIWLQIKYEISHEGKIQSKIFPNECQGLISTGEITGTLPDMLRRCEKICAFEVEELSSQIPVKAEIFGTLFVGLIVTLIVFSVIVPILSIGI